MPITFRDKAQTAEASTANLVLNAPAGAKPGDLMIAAVVSGHGDVTITPPAGWTLIRNDASGSTSTDQRVALYRRFFQAGDTNWTWTLTGTTTNVSGGIVAYSGVDATNPIDAQAGQGNAPGGGNVPVPAITNPIDNTLVSIESSRQAANYNSFAGTERIDYGGVGFASFQIEDLLATAGPKASGVATVTTFSASQTVGQRLSLRPAQTPTVRGIFQGSGTAASFSMTRSGVQLGDLLLVEVITTPPGSTVTPPAGWTLVTSIINQGYTSWLYRRTGVASEPASDTWSFSGTPTFGYQLVVIAGAADIDVSTSGFISGVTTGIAVPSITPTVSDVLDIQMLAGSAVDYVPPTGEPMVGEITSTFRLECAAEALSSPQATGTRTWTTGGNSSTIHAYRIAVKPPSGQPKIRSARSTSQNAGIGSSIVANMPPDVQSGDLLVAVLSWGALPGVVTPPSGWTEVEDGTAAAPYFKAYTKTATGSEGATQTWSWTNTPAITANIACLVGSGTLDIDGKTNTVSSPNLSFPSITTTGPSRALLFFGTVAAGATTTPPVGVREIVDDNVTPSAKLFYEVQISAGATGARAAGLSGTFTSSGYVISISGNSVPNTPTNLQRTGLTSDTTPVFSADISDPDSSQQIKARFSIYQSDGVTLIGTVDSSFRTGAGTVTAEYASALATGTYKVSAVTIDDQGAVSSSTAQVTFIVTQAVSKDVNMLWNVRALTTKDASLLWNVQVSNQIDIHLLWAVHTNVQTDFTLLWGQRDSWTPVPQPDNHELWTEVPS